MITFCEANLEDRKSFYENEWNASNLPNFIKSTIEKREFAFDIGGSGPNDRYNQFSNLDDLKKYIKTKYPYAIYSSVSFYDYPKKREGWQGAELVFDIDAKDLPIKSCECRSPNICEKCLQDAKHIALSVLKLLKDDFDLKDIHLIYSGRGYHIRVQDREVYPIEDRNYILDYILASDNKDFIKNPQNLFTTFGYSKVYRERLKFVIKNLKKEDLRKEGFASGRIEKFIQNREDIIESLDKRDVSKFQKAISLGEKTLDKLFSLVSRINAQLVDARVTVDVKRILRLPTSLHSKVSMVCTHINSIENFNPLNQAIPQFRKK